MIYFVIAGCGVAFAVIAYLGVYNLRLLRDRDRALEYIDVLEHCWAEERDRAYVMEQRLQRFGHSAPTPIRDVRFQMRIPMGEQ